jgi:hypothetical protein
LRGAPQEITKRTHGFLLSREITKRTHGFLLSREITKRTQGFLPSREITKRTQGTLLRDRFDIRPMFAPAWTTDGMRSGDVMDNIGEILAGGT